MILKLQATAVKAVFLVGLLVFIVSFVASESIMGIFSRGNAELLHIGGIGLKLFSIAFILNGYNIIALVFFTSIGENKVAALVSSLRSLILLVIFLWVLPYLLGDIGIWLTTPLAEAVTLVVAYLLMNRSKEKLA